MSTSTRGIAPTAVCKITKKGAIARPINTNMAVNATTWAFIQAQIKAGINTYGGLQIACRDNNGHGSFVGYAVRSGWLTTVAAAKPAPATKTTK